MARPLTQRARLGSIIAAVSGAVLAIGSFLSWATVEVEFFGDSDSATVSGTDGGDGYITLVVGIAAVVVAVLLLSGRPFNAAWIILLVAGIIGTLVALANIGNVDDVAEEIGDFGDASVGPGLVLCAIGGIGVIVGAVMARRLHD